MTLKTYASVLALSAAVSVSVSAQVPEPTPLPKLSSQFLAKIGSPEKLSDPSAEDRRLAYAKLLEGQRYIWKLTHSRKDRSRAALESNASLAREALVSAVT